MNTADVAGAMRVVQESAGALERAQGHEPQPLPDEAWELFRRRTARFVERDPAGSWVAVEGDTVVGMAQSVRRGSFWGLSMLFVHPTAQNQGLGRRLLAAALTYAGEADIRMIMTSPDPRALRLYALAGLALHPAVRAEGDIDRSSIPVGLAGRAGDAGDLDLVAEVDAGLRGSRAEEVEFLLELGARLEVIDTGAGRGYVLYQGQRLRMLGATDRPTAGQLLWRFLAEAGDRAEVEGLTAGQDWAVQIALAAKLSVLTAGPLFVSGLRYPPEFWLPSGWYF